LIYVMRVRNAGGITSQPVTLTDNLPLETSFISCTAAGGGVCSTSANSVTVAFPPLAVGASVMATVTVKVNGSVADGTIISNTANVASATPDPDMSNNSSTAGVTVKSSSI